MFEFLMNPVAQDPAYHALADQRVVLGIPNFWNVVSNLAFLAAGWAGLAETARHRAEPLRVAWFTFFAGIATVGVTALLAGLRGRRRTGQAVTQIPE